jgi:hypothetical protein
MVHIPNQINIFQDSFVHAAIAGTFKGFAGLLTLPGISSKNHPPVEGNVRQNGFTYNLLPTGAMLIRIEMDLRGPPHYRHL